MSERIDLILYEATVNGWAKLSPEDCQRILGEVAALQARAERAEADAERNHRDCDRLLMAGNNLQHRLAVWEYKSAGQTLPIELADAVLEYDMEITAILSTAHDAGKDER